MPKAIILREHGNADVLQLQDVEVGSPGPGELRIRQTAVGVNFHDAYVRSGAYRTLPLPGTPGIEAVGVVEAVGREVSGFVPGQRIVYVTSMYGAYAGARILPASLALALPDTVDDVTAASIMLKGLTACMLVRHVHQVKPGETVLIHAAAGGVGQLLCAWACHLGARVIGTAGSAEKAEIARRCGADAVILYRTEDVAVRVAEITGGEGVAAAYDAVGRDTFMASLNSLGYFGMLVNYGQASGAVDPISPSVLGAKSNTLSRPVIFHYVRRRNALEAMAKEVFEALATGVIRPQTSLQLPLASAAEAHRTMEERRSTGSIVLVP